MIIQKVFYLSCILFLAGCVKDQSVDLTFDDRAAILLHYAADTYLVPQANYSDPEKVYWPAAIARMTLYGETDSAANSWIEKFSNKSPFHFILVGMARLMPLFMDAPAMQENHLQYLKNVMDRKDSYNAWTCEGTENHITMSRTSGYLYAEMMEQYPEIFPEAEKLKEEMKRWIHYFSKRIYQTGTGEYNASTYGVFNIIGFLNLYDFAKDPEVKAMARAVLDYYASEIALHYFQGMTGGPESRGMPKPIACRAETDYLGWLWFGDAPKPVDHNFYKNNTYKPPMQCVHAATSNYRPPKQLQFLAGKSFREPIYHINAKPAYLLNHPGYITHRQYTDPSFSLGSANYPYGAFGSSTYKNVTWKLISRTDFGPGKNPSMITGGGMYYPDLTGKMRNPWHQLVQHNNVLIQMNKMPVNASEIIADIQIIYKSWANHWDDDFTMRFSTTDDKIENVGNPVKFQKGGRIGDEGNGCYITFPEEADYFESGDLIFLILEHAYIAVRSLNGKPKLDKLKNIITDKAPLGRSAGLILEAVPSRFFESSEDFFHNYATSTSIRHYSADSEYCYISYYKDTICFNYQDSGSFTEPIYDWGYGPAKPSVIHTSPPYIQPVWPSGEGHGRIPSWTVNGKEAIQPASGTVYDGPFFRLINGVLTIQDESEEVFKVDYRDNMPVFNNVD